MSEPASAARQRSLWIDLSTTLHWTGTPVGMVRTEIMVARELLSAGTPGLRFCSFDARLRAYREIPRSEAERLLREADSAGEGTDAVQAAPRGTAAVGAWIEKVVLSGIGRLPERLRAPVHAWCAACVCLLGASARVLRAMLPARRPPRPPEPVGPFAPGDCYLSMGLDWDHNDLAVLGAMRSRLGLRVFLMCYDLIPIYQPQYLVPGYRERIVAHFTAVLACADAIFTISEDSGRQLRRYARETGVTLPPIEVIRLGAHVSTHEERAIPQLAQKRFVLTVGTFEVRKNHRLLYEVWMRMQTDREFPDPPALVIVGRRGWRVDDLIGEMTDNPLTHACVHRFENVSDEELNWLYGHCLFTVFPSFSEGLGLPVVESLAHGKYCLSSNTSSLPEAGQDLTMLLDPLDFVSWYGAIKRLVQDESLRREKEARIRSAFKGTTWRDTARAIHDSIQAIGTA